MKKEIKNILVATDRLSHLSGTETYTYSIIEELVRRDLYNVEYFTLSKGIVSEKIERNLNVKFFSKKKYDLILANHTTCVDFLYKKGFIIQTCHGIYPDLEQPSSKAQAFVSVSQEVQHHLAILGIPSILILNGINLNRYYCKNEISKKLTTVLSLCQSIEANEFVQKACEEKGLNFLKAFKYENPKWNVEDEINKADLIVGLGRSAYEAMACGRPVVVFDKRNYFESYSDGYVKENLGFSILNNCSGRFSKAVYKNTNDIQLEFSKYDKNDSRYFRDFAEKQLDIRLQIDKYLNYYYTICNSRRSSSFQRLLNRIFIS